ncbi:hypothetical protein HPP92_006813 [Vanilla planifolia]|uniref:Uncharacterized protein n=1 Tax=Vanilla planifolia TaxID=51239 RepID=A0A835RCX0_VANPL|nr:hypothetical protein HPP92_007068 [Vanilla planifolia]KAG0489950.1 hypothetical protein HPP92_006813 [Vanilla planifolia]
MSVKKKAEEEERERWELGELNDLSTFLGREKAKGLATTIYNFGRRGCKDRRGPLAVGSRSAKPTDR